MDSRYLESAQKGFNWRSLTLFLITICAVVVCFLLIQPFVAAITGAIVLAIVTQRPHNWVRSKLRNGTLAAAASLIAVILSIIVPAIFLAQSLGRHAIRVAHMVQNGTAERGLDRFLDQSPRISAALQYSIHNLSLNQAAEKSASFIASKLAAVLGTSFAALAQIVIMLFLLFFLYRDRGLAISSLRSILPLNESETDYFLKRIHDTIEATILGRVAVAGAQGLVAGIAFVTLGVSGASLLGILTALSALVPSFGAFIVWLPVAVYLALTHHWVQAIILAAIGSLVISTLDNFLYPVLVGTKLRLHTVPIFLSILGGIWLFGVPGLILGPIVFALTESLLAIWRQRIERETAPENPLIP